MATRQTSTSKAAQVAEVQALVQKALAAMSPADQARMLANMATATKPSTIATCESCLGTGRPLAPRTGIAILKGLQDRRCLCCTPKDERPEKYRDLKGCADSGKCAAGMISNLEYMRKTEPEELALRVAIAKAHPVTEVKA